MQSERDCATWCTVPPSGLYSSNLLSMQVRPSTLFNRCHGHYALAAINIWCMEQVLALFKAAQGSKAPFIVQMTPVALGYGKREMLLSMIKAAAKIYPETVYAIHLDHGDEQTAGEVISGGGFSSVMIDASHEPFEQNIAITRGIVGKAHEAGLEVEAELGVLSGVEDDLEVETGMYTRPEEVVEFVARTGCDSLAIAIGTSHGAYKFRGGQGLQLHILDEIQRALPGFPLVLHGASAVDPREVERINASGGKLEPGASGVASAEIQKAIARGVCKVNIATDARILWNRVHREYFREHPGNFDPLPPGRIYMTELEELYGNKFSLLGANNRISEGKL